MRFYLSFICGAAMTFSVGAVAQVQEVKTDIQMRVYRPTTEDFKKFSSEEQRSYQAAGLTPYAGRTAPALNKVAADQRAAGGNDAVSGDRAVRATRPANISPADLAPLPQKRSARPQLGAKGSLNLRAPATPSDDPNVSATGNDVSPGVIE